MAQYITEIIIAILGFAGSLAGSFGGMKLMSYRIEQLEKKVEKLSEKQDKYNNLQERVALAEKDIRVANNRIGDLERKVEEI